MGDTDPAGQQPPARDNAPADDATDEQSTPQPDPTPPDGGETRPETKYDG